MGEPLNNLFTQWIEELYSETLLKCNNSSSSFSKSNSMNSLHKKKFIYKKALDSLKSYQKPLYSVQDATLVNGIGPSLSKALQKKLLALQMNMERAPFSNTFVPNPNSNFANLMIAMYKCVSINLTKETILANCTPCSPFLWRSMGGLIKKGFVEKTDSELYQLTFQGYKIAEQLFKHQKVVPEMPNSNEPNPFNSEESKTIDSIHPTFSLDIISSSTNFWKSNSFDLIIILDNREIGSRNDRAYIYRELSRKISNTYSNSNMIIITQPLPLGDIVFAIRHKINGIVLILDLIIERKREDDLISSIIDGRFSEQKFRLRRCGLNQAVLLVEKHHGSSSFGLSEHAIFSNVVKSVIVDGVFLKEMDSTNHTVDYLVDLYHEYKRKLKNTSIVALYQTASMSRDEYLKLRLYIVKNPETLLSTGTPMIDGLSLKKSLILFNFYDWCELNSKTKGNSVSDVFLKMLISSVKGLSPEKALMITNKYKTMRELLDAYRNAEEKSISPMYLLSADVGENLSSKIYALITANKNF